MLINAATCTWGLSDLELIEIHKSYGPQLRFTFTWLVDLEDGRTIAQSTPGFRYIKKVGGEFKVEPPLKKTTTYATYYATIVSTDLCKLIEKKLIEDNWQSRVGKNNKVENLLKEPINI